MYVFKMHLHGVLLKLNMKHLFLTLDSARLAPEQTPLDASLSRSRVHYLVELRLKFEGFHR